MAKCTCGVTVVTPMLTTFVAQLYWVYPSFVCPQLSLLTPPPPSSLLPTFYLLPPPPSSPPSTSSLPPPYLLPPPHLPSTPLHLLPPPYLFPTSSSSSLPPSLLQRVPGVEAGDRQNEDRTGPPQKEKRCEFKAHCIHTCLTVCAKYMCVHMCSVHA